MRAFISYSTHDKQYALQAKDALEGVDIDSFLALRDIRLASDWRLRIVDALRHCDLFVPILSEDFKRSNWAPQEVGFAAALAEEGVRRKPVVAPLSVDGTAPFGFISHLQGKPIPSTGVNLLMFVDALQELPWESEPSWLTNAVEERTLDEKLGTDIRTLERRRIMLSGSLDMQLDVKRWIGNGSYEEIVNLVLAVVSRPLAKPLHLDVINGKYQNLLESPSPCDEVQAMDDLKRKHYYLRRAIVEHWNELYPASRVGSFWETLCI